MKKRLVLISSIAAAVAAVSAGVVINAQADRRNASLRASLRGLNEVPPTTSRGSATLRGTVDQDAQTMTFTIDYQNLTVAPTAAHVHFGPSRVNGGVMFFFCGGGGQASCPTTTSGTITATVTAASVVGPTAQGVAAGDFANAIRAIATGNGYANIHTPTFPGGEVRGQVRSFGLRLDDDRDDLQDDEQED